MRAQLLHLTGPLRGETITYEKRELLFGSADDADVRYTEGLTIRPRHARLTFSADGCVFHFRALEGEIFVNEKEVAEVDLEDGDLLQIGRNGPRMRFRVHAAGGRPCKPVTQMLRDAREVGHASGIYASSLLLKRDLTRHTTWRFRILFPLVVVALAFAVAYVGSWLGTQRRVDESATRLREQAELFEQERENLRIQLEEFRRRQAGHATLDEVVKLREQLDRHGSVVDTLVTEKAAFKRVLEVYSDGVCLLHGIFTLELPRGGKLIPVKGPDGKPLELEYVGSGFLASEAGHVITNRHVAEPWWQNKAVAPLLERGFRPRFIRLAAAFPGRPPIDVDPKTIRLSGEGMDVAVLQVAVKGVPVLPLTEREVGEMRGGRVVLLGYPTGVNAILARAEPEMVKEVLAAASDTTSLIRELARRKAISPVITQGALNEVKPTKLVYDAETTSGGSGGPVFGPDGRVIGVNFAITRDFDGSNFGVPIVYAKRLLP